MSDQTKLKNKEIAQSSETLEALTMNCRAAFGNIQTTVFKSITWLNYALFKQEPDLVILRQ